MEYEAECEAKRRWMIVQHIIPPRFRSPTPESQFMALTGEQQRDLCNLAARGYTYNQISFMRGYEL